MLDYCFSQLKDLKYVLIKDHDVKEGVNPYKVVPRIWITGRDEAFYPITFGKGQACWVDHIIKECEKPLPKKKFKKISMQEVFDSGITTIIMRYLCSCVMIIFVFFSILDDYVQIMDLLVQFRKEPDRMSETIGSQRSTGESQRPTRTKTMSLKSMEAMQLPTDSDRYDVFHNRHLFSCVVSGFILCYLFSYCNVVDAAALICDDREEDEDEAFEAFVERQRCPEPLEFSPSVTSTQQSPEESMK